MFQIAIHPLHVIWFNVWASLDISMSCHLILWHKEFIHTDGPIILPQQLMPEMKMLPSFLPPCHYHGTSFWRWGIFTARRFLPPASAVEVIKTGLSVWVCLCGCPCVSTLRAEPFDVWSQNLVQALTLVISWTSLMGKVIGQGHQVKKRYFHGLLIWVNRYQTLAYGVASWRHVMAWYDVTWRCGMASWRHLMSQNDFKRTRPIRMQEVQQHFSVFRSIISII